MICTTIKSIQRRFFKGALRGNRKVASYCGKRLRNLAKINYRIHTGAIQQHLIPLQLSAKQTSLVCASEADVPNLALFGMNTAQWRGQPGQKGNMRDEADVTQLTDSPTSKISTINRRLKTY